MRGQDFPKFADLLRNEARPFFDAGGRTFVTRAPGRIDVMGGVADYSGSMVLEGTIADAAFIGLQLRRDDRLRIWSYGAEKEDLDPQAEFRLSDLRAGDRLRSYARVNALMSARPQEAWAAYVLGAYYVLQREKAAPAFKQGANILLHSKVPLGGGVSSSAALEVAGMHAICRAYGIELAPLELARLCQVVENRVVGAPCGIMDQVTIALGEQGSLLPIICRPHDVLSAEKLPPGWRVSGINSRVKHAVGGYRYTRARCGAFMGRKIIESRLGSEFVGGYLCNVTPERYRRDCRDLLPPKMTGEAFLAQYGNTDDPMTSPIPDMLYSVRAGAEHPIYENARVTRFIELLGQAETRGERAMIAAGKLMYGSHWSYGHLCALGAPETDLLVRLVRQRGHARGLYGAKITGGGSGGTVAVLAREGCDEAINEIFQAYEAQTGLRPDVFRGTSPGAYAWGSQQL